MQPQCSYSRSLRKVWPAGLVGGLKERSSGLHQLLPGGRIRADIMLLVTYIHSHTRARARPHTHFILCKTSTAKAWEGE